MKFRAPVRAADTLRARMTVKAWSDPMSRMDQGSRVSGLNRVSWRG